MPNRAEAVHSPHRESGRSDDSHLQIMKTLKVLGTTQEFLLMQIQVTGKCSLPSSLFLQVPAFPHTGTASKMSFSMSFRALFGLKGKKAVLACCMPERVSGGHVARCTASTARVSRQRSSSARGYQVQGYKPCTEISSRQH